MLFRERGTWFVYTRVSLKFRERTQTLQEEVKPEEYTQKHSFTQIDHELVLGS